MNKNIILLPALLVASCATPQPELGPWGYDFALGTFKDARPEDDAKLMAVMPFNVDSFMAAWGKNVNRSVFGQNPAKLDVVLKRYEATQSGWSYALSMDVQLTGRDSYGQTIAVTQASCAVENQSTSANTAGVIAQQVVNQRDLTALTPERRAATMWQRVMDKCVKDLEIQFGNSLAAR